jgi:predicted kinase
MENIATLFVMVGIPGSGKSTISKSLNCSVFSSDSIRFELFGTEEIDETMPIEEIGKNNRKVFAILHKRVISSLENGKSCVYDATSVSKGSRTDIIKLVKGIPCKKVCIFVDTPFDICKERNANRTRTVHEQAMQKMINNLVPPSKDEGWDKIYEIVTI